MAESASGWVYMGQSRLKKGMTISLVISFLKTEAGQGLAMDVYAGLMKLSGVHAVAPFDGTALVS